MRIIRAIYDKTLYQQSLKEKLSKPLLSWFLISSISFFVMVLFLGIILSKNIPTTAELTESLPKFEIVDGIMSIEEKQEYFDEQSGFLFVLDDEYEFNEEKVKNTPQYFIATKENFYVKFQDQELLQKPYSEFEWLKNTNNETLISNVKSALPKDLGKILVLFGLIFLLLFFVGNIFVKFLSILFYSLIGLITSSIFKKELTFDELMKIVLYGNILPTILGTVYFLITTNPVNIFLSFLFISAYTGYFIYTINKNSGEKTVIPMVEGVPDTVVSKPTEQVPTIGNPV